MTELNKETELEASTDTAIDYSTCYAQPSIQLHNCDNLELMAKMKDNSVDVILTDPPYLYLKNQKLEREFDEELFFNECKRVLNKNGFIAIFGRGTSFYRWNIILTDFGFQFKEEIVWDKMQISSPLNSLMRVHELIAIYSKGSGKINKVKVPITEAYEFEPKKIVEAIYRITTTFGNRKTFDLVKDYFESGKSLFNEGKERRFNASISSDFQHRNRTVQFAVGLEEGITERSIIKYVREHYTSIHPTQKPVGLLERLLALLVPKEKEPSDIVVFDPFGGSFSTMVAVYNMQMQGISCEIDEEYFEAGKKRIKNLPPVQTTLFD